MTTQIATHAAGTDVTEAGASDAHAATDRVSAPPLDIRVSIPLLSRRYYLTILSGPERRSQKRLQEEREKHPLVTRANVIFLFSIGFVLGGSSWIGLQSVVTYIYNGLIR